MSAPSGPPPPSVPEGWIAKFDEKYKTYYYVNLASGKSQWEPPAAAPSHQRRGSHDGPPPYSEASRPSPQGNNSAPRQTYGQSAQPPRQYEQGNGQYDQRNYYNAGPGPQGPGGYPPQGAYGEPQRGYYPPPPQAGYGYPPPQPVYQQVPAQQPQKSRFGGMGGMALGAGAGLLGGYLLGEAMAPDQTVVENNYYGDDYGGDMGGGDDYGGGDW